MHFQPTSTTETQATSLLGTQADQGVLPISFEKNTEYTTFTAEHAFDGDDIVFHFYPTEDHGSKSYWQDLFPDCLSEVAQKFFDASYPRLKAAFTSEQNSWWMRANGFANVGIPLERIASFYQQLDQALEAENAKRPRD